MNKRAVIYARFSTENQRDASIDDQFRLCARVIESEGFELVARFEDRGISGGTDQRPGYQAMLSMARTNGFDIVVAEDISRLWRSKVEYSTRSAEFQDLGIQLVTCTGDDTRREGWGLLFDIKAAIAAQMRKDIAHKTRRGLEGKALAGKSTGGSCFGYSRNPDGSWAVYEPQAAIVRDVFYRAAAGHPLRAIAAHLNSASVPSPRGGVWGDTTISALLRNRRYLGDVIYGSHEVRTSAMDSAVKRRVKRSEPVSIRHEDDLMIISPEVFDTVQKVRTASLALRPWLRQNSVT